MPASWITATGLEPQIVSTGLRDIFVPFADRKKLFAIKPDFDELKKLSWSQDVVGVHAFTLDAIDKRAAAHSRNFAPLYGINEESATGSSTGALACYLRRRGSVSRDDRKALVFEQGDSMKRPSEITARLDTDGNRIMRVRVGGFASGT